MRRRLASGLCCLVAVVGVATATRVAKAACGTPDLVDTLPPDGSNDVPTNTPLSATYEVGATHAGEPVVVTAGPGSQRQLAASYSRSLRTLTVTLPGCAPDADPTCVPDPDFPNGALEPDTRYTVEWPGLRASQSVRVGGGATVTFTTGAGPDNSRPSFDGARSVDWDFEREYDSCSDTESERYVFELDLDPVTYAGGVDLLTLHVYQTAGRLLDRDDNGHLIAEEVYRARYKGQRTIKVKRAIATSVGHACFSAFVEAPNGQISEGAEREACTTTEHPPFFEGCSLGAPAPTRPSGRFGWLAVAGLLWARARRRTPQSRTRT